MLGTELVVVVVETEMRASKSVASNDDDDFLVMFHVGAVLRHWSRYYEEPYRFSEDAAHVDIDSFETFYSQR